MAEPGMGRTAKPQHSRALNALSQVHQGVWCVSICASVCESVCVCLHTLMSVRVHTEVRGQFAGSLQE